MINKLSPISVDKMNPCSNYTQELNFHDHDEKIKIQAELYHQSKINGIECSLGQSIPFVGKPDAIIKALGKHYLVDIVVNSIGDKRSVSKLNRYLRLNCPIFMLVSADHIPYLVDALLNDLRFVNAIYLFDEDVKQFLEYY
jgi:hypothetical protein